MASNIISAEFVKSKLTLLLGSAFCILIFIFIVLTIPVYIFRLVVIFLAKLFRSDLGDILGGLSAVLVTDYLAETTPRSNVVRIFVFEGQLTLDLVKKRISKNWIVRRGPFVNFQRYPVKWLGFTFWKDASNTFSMENHVQIHSGKDTQVNDLQLMKVVETMLNTKTPKFQSPWEMRLIENYKYPHSARAESQPNNQSHSVLILKWHHCLMDGVGEMTAVMNGLFEQSWKQKPEAPTPKVAFVQKVVHALTFPLKAFCELSYVFSHVFRKDPFKVPDQSKDWHQVAVKSGPIPIQVIKDIKNTFGVSYTSVLLSVMSAAVHKTLNSGSSSSTSPLQNKSMLCLSILPPIGASSRKVLANHMTGALVDLPTVRFDSPIERLDKVNGLFENARKSLIPILAQYYCTLLGAHMYMFNRILAKNRMIPIGLTNFAGLQENVLLYNKVKLIDSWVFAGGHIGQAGVGVMVLSHGQKAEFHVCAERALMPRKQAEKFMQHVLDEIALLQNLSIQALC